MNPAALRNEDNATAPVLYMALELSNKSWRLAFGDGAKRRQVSVPAADRAALAGAVAKAKERFKMPASVRVVSCYEAGRDGFWRHRHLVSIGIENQVVDAASIEVSRRLRHVKTDRLDGDRLLAKLIRHHASRPPRVPCAPPSSCASGRRCPRCAASRSAAPGSSTSGSPRTSRTRDPALGSPPPWCAGPGSRPSGRTSSAASAGARARDGRQTDARVRGGRRGAESRLHHHFALDSADREHHADPQRRIRARGEGTVPGEMNCGWRNRRRANRPAPASPAPLVPPSASPPH